ncbi:cytochrome c oxidase subunit 3 [Celeribacter neptunius]|uniref:Nitric oxide reductase NorE protein n=1 Tax=Celeribacter neptunius TaxID=588602 RepID=A0A1I3R6R9_9RHOB|nr:cytochrome c oxidase subunit 3 [Celeribacter neptunius]SFJ41750.1 nitric oxide reductase NorE protein [Celeribacter neptunius]
MAQVAREELPHDLMIWVLIVSEMLVFGAGLWAFLAVRITDPPGFAEAATHLHPVSAGIGTILLVTSGLFAAIGAQRNSARWLLLAALGGLAFLWLKSHEWSSLIAAQISTETHPFFTFYYLLTGFHAAHVVAGIVILAIVALRRRSAEISAGVAFWHLVDLVWVAVFPVIYLMGAA